MLKMTAGNDQPQTIKMSTQPENKINKNILSDKIHPLKDTIENKHIKHTVQKCINFTEDNYTESNNETSANEPNRQKIERAKYIPGKEGDPVLEDFRILTGSLFYSIFCTKMSFLSYVERGFDYQYLSLSNITQKIILKY